MIHLFDSLYITYAECAVGPESLSKTTYNFFQIIDKGLINIDHKYFKEFRYFYAKDIKTVIENYGSSIEFFTFIENELKKDHVDKIVIYADEKSMSEFLIRWWKGIFPNIKLDGIISLFNLFADSETLQGNNPYSFINLAVDSTNIPFQYFSKIYWDKSSEQIRGLDSLYNAFEVPEAVLDELSIEYKILSYIIDKRSINIDLLEEKLLSIYKKRFMREVYGIRRMGLRSLPRLIAYNFPEVPVSTYIKRMSNLEKLKGPLDFSQEFFLDHELDESEKSFDYFFKEYDYIKILNDLLKVEKILIYNGPFSDELTKADNPYITFFLENNRHPSVDELIEDLASGTNRFQVLKNLEQENKANPYYLSCLIPYYKTSHVLIDQFKVLKNE